MALKISGAVMPRARGTGCVCLCAVGLLHAGVPLAQELEPRAYSNLPVGLNFLAGGYLRSQGGLAISPALPIENAQLAIDTGVLVYVRALDLWGRSGKFDAIAAYSHLSGNALAFGQPIERDIHGLGDPRFRLAVNFFGAPAISLSEFPAFKQDLVAGASVQVSVPLSQYDPNRAVNLGTNRWSIKPDIGFSKTFAAYMFDFTAGATFFGRNDDYFGGRTLEQEPLYTTQANLSYDFGRGIWAAVGATYYWGGQTRLDNVPQDNALGNSRLGLTLALPIDRHYSVKLNASSGISTRTGTSFDILGLVLQYRWGAGL
jgi:hypothetical protein